MKSNKILLLGEDKRTSNLLVSLFKEKETEVFIVTHIADAVNLIASSEIPLILIDYKTIVAAERAQLVELFRDARKTKFVVFNVPDDASRRLAFYKLGAFRIFGFDYTVEDIYYFSLNLLSNEKPYFEEKETRFSGNLQDFNLPSLINNFGKEKRNGVLRIQTPVSSGKIYFNAGHIYHASTGNLKDDEAILFMLTWNKGRFSMSPLAQKKVKNRIRISNVGLLLQGEIIRDEFSALIKELGGISKEVKIVNRGDLLHKEKDTDFRNLIDKMDDFRQVFDIIENSPFPMIDTLNQLVQLKKSKNLQLRDSTTEFEDLYTAPVQESSGLVEKLLSKADIDKLRKNLRATEVSSGKLLILGSRACGKSEFIRQFNQGSLTGVKSNQELDFTLIELTENFSLQVFGIALEEKLSQIIQKLSEGLVGYIFLIDAKNDQDLEYTNYVISNLIATHEVPYTLAVTNLEKSAKKVPAKIKSSIRLSKGKTLHACDVKNKEDVRRVIMSLKA